MLERLLDDVYHGAERSVVLQPVEERSHSLRQRSLQLRNVTLGFTEETERTTKTSTTLFSLLRVSEETDKSHTQSSQLHSAVNRNTPVVWDAGVCRFLSDASTPF